MVMTSSLEQGGGPLRVSTGAIGTSFSPSLVGRKVRGGVERLAGVDPTTAGGENVASLREK